MGDPSHLSILTRTIKYDKDGKIILDVIVDKINGITYPTPEKEINPSRRYQKFTFNWEILIRERAGKREVSLRERE